MGVFEPFGTLLDRFVHQIRMIAQLLQRSYIRKCRQAGLYLMGLLQHTPADRIRLEETLVQYGLDVRHFHTDDHLELDRQILGQKRAGSTDHTTVHLGGEFLQPLCCFLAVGFRCVSILPPKDRILELTAEFLKEKFKASAPKILYGFTDPLLTLVLPSIPGLTKCNKL